ncbi:LytR/AlgR family response regulator transcription factor [Fusibacter ferrireducens]|uniref:Stage 0 sporulation protein A homolog n=1 Tax=Fusibacter ferrireducens TaxID=2785058 RepID=A0ABR9ZP53_9FIRM|nr:LytTR family DNA-binding domain-containing protein [Fusibacter ferrireducens]MBF4692231.1 response regulator transcription factor [Fusibacter ferrireducens]
MNIGICDDLCSDLVLLEEYILLYMNTHNIDCTIYKFESGDNLLADLKYTQYDILFLDIYMQGKNGIEIARTIRNAGLECIIIFTTTSPDHALDGFEVGAVHYLIKPLNYENVQSGLARCSQIFEQSRQYIEVKSGRTILRIILKDLIFAEVYGNTLLIHTVSTVVKTYVSLDAFIKLLPAENFLRCHRSYVVNMNFIASQEGSDFVLKDGAIIPIPKKDRQLMRQKYSDYLFSRVRRRSRVY